MTGIYGFNFEQVELNISNNRKKRVKTVWVSEKNKYLGISSDIIEKTAFKNGDEVILLVDKKKGVFCLTSSEYSHLEGSARICFYSKSNTRGMSCVINGKDIVAKVKIISEQMNYFGSEFDAWTTPDGSILFKPKEA